MSIISSLIEGDTSWSEAWDQSFGKYGLGGFLSGGAAAAQDSIVAQGKGIVSGGIQDLQDYTESTIDLFERQKESKISGVGSAVSGDLTKTKDYSNTLAMKSNMATSVDMTSGIEKNLIDKYNNSISDINLESQKNQVDFIASMKDKKTQLLMDYTSATGKTYKGSADNSFDDFISQFS